MSALSVAVCALVLDGVDRQLGQVRCAPVHPHGQHAAGLVYPLLEHLGDLLGPLALAQLVGEDGPRVGFHERDQLEAEPEAGKVSGIHERQGSVRQVLGRVAAASGLCARLFRLVFAPP